MREDWHIATRLIRLDHHLHRHILVGEVTARLTLGICLLAKEQCGLLSQFALIGFTHHLEIGGGLQVVTLDTLREVEYHALASCQHAFLGVGLAEQLRTSRILHTAEYLRTIGQQTVAITNEDNGSQVIGFLHDLTLSVELGIDVAVLRDHGIRATGSLIECRVGIESTEVGPVVVTTRGLLILELDMVEVLLGLVIAADDYGQVPAAYRVIRRIGIHDPLVARRRNLHIACRLQEVNAELRIGKGLDVTLRAQTQSDVLVVEVLAGIHLQSLLCHLAWHNLHDTGIAAERYAVYHQFGTIGVGVLFQRQIPIAIGSLGQFTLVGHIELEAGWLVVGHAALALPVEHHNGVLNLLRAFVHNGTATIVVRGTIRLPRTTGSTATGTIDEALGKAEVAGGHLAQIRQVAAMRHLIGNRISQVVIVVVDEDVVLAIRGLQTVSIGISLDTIDIEHQVALTVHTDGETLLTRVLLAVAIRVADRVVKNGSEGHAELITRHFYAKMWPVFLFRRFGHSIQQVCK